MKILSGHTSPETAYTVDDYPYGYRLRCRIRYWLEFKPGFGFRMLSQTSNPKRGHSWNKPKASIYARFGAALYRDDNGHVQMAVLTEYSTAAEAAAWWLTYGDGVPAEHREITRKWVAAKDAYEANRSDGDPLVKGTREAVKAWRDTP